MPSFPYPTRPGYGKLGTHDERKILDHQLPQQTRKGCIWQFLQAQKRIEEVIDLEEVVAFLFNAYVGVLGFEDFRSSAVLPAV